MKVPNPASLGWRVREGSPRAMSWAVAPPAGAAPRRARARWVGGPGEPFSGIWAVSPTQAPADALAEVRGLFLLLVPAPGFLPRAHDRPCGPTADRLVSLSAGAGHPLLDLDKPLCHLGVGLFTRLFPPLGRSRLVRILMISQAPPHHQSRGVFHRGPKLRSTPPCSRVRVWVACPPCAGEGLLRQGPGPTGMRRWSPRSSSGETRCLTQRDGGRTSQPGRDQSKVGTASQKSCYLNRSLGEKR